MTFACGSAAGAGSCCIRNAPWPRQAMSGDAQHACPADHEQEPGQGHQRVRADADSRPHAHFAFATDRSVGLLQLSLPAWLPVAETSGVRIAGPGGIKQVEIAFDRIPQFVLRVAAVAAVLAPPARADEPAPRPDLRGVAAAHRPTPGSVASATRSLS